MSECIKLSGPFVIETLLLKGKALRLANLQPTQCEKSSIATSLSTTVQIKHFKLEKERRHSLKCHK